MSLATSITLSTLELTRFFFAMVLLLFTAHSFGFLFYEAKLPRVIGEIFGGLVLGPTFLGYVAPDAENWVFGAFVSEGALISLISYFGLVLLMFISGFEIQRSFSREDRKIATSFLVGATVVPFVIGVLVPYVYNFAPYSGLNGNSLSLAIIVGIGVSVTSIPVISKIFIDLKIMITRFAQIVFGAFLAGIAIGMMPEEIFALAKSQVKSISLAVFTPVYFAVVGLKLDLIHSFDTLFFLGFLLFSTALKGGGALAVGRLIKQKRLPSLNLAIALNARGGPGIVLATVAFDLGMISETFFVALVLTAIITSLIAGFWLRYVKKKGWQLL